MPEELSDPIPTKLHPSEVEYLDALKKRTGLSRSEIIRRSVWLLLRELEKAPDVHALLGALADERTKAHSNQEADLHDRDALVAKALAASAPQTPRAKSSQRSAAGRGSSAKGPK